MIDSSQNIFAHQQLLSHLGISKTTVLGKGMQSMVYDFNHNQVIKIYLDSSISIERLKELQSFYQNLNWDNDKILIPQIIDIGNYQDLFYSIEKKLIGKNANVVFIEAEAQVKTKLLNNYFALLGELQKIKVNDQFGEQLAGKLSMVKNDNWRTVIQEKLVQTRNETVLKPQHNIKNISRLFDKYFNEILPKINPRPIKNLVHGDLFLENVLAERDGAITALLDFGPLTMIGDHMMDVAGLVYFASVSEGITQETVDYLEKLAKQKYPEKLQEIRNYLLYYSLYFINSMNYDPRTYAWCLHYLTKFGYLDS